MSDLLERFFMWLSSRLAPYIIIDIQVGGHCGICGKWVPDVLVETHWAWTLCKDCDEKGRKKLEGE